MERQRASICGLSLDGFRHHGESTAHAGETAILGEAAKFDRTFTRTRDLKNRARNLRVVDVSFVSSIEENQGPVLSRITYPLHKLVARGDGARRIIGKT